MRTLIGNHDMIHGKMYTLYKTKNFPYKQLYHRSMHSPKIYTNIEFIHVSDHK